MADTVGESLPQKIIAWLDKQGYPLEMSVARLLIEARFGVHQGMYFEDPIEKVEREIDVAAWLKTSSGFPLQMMFQIECKAPRHPLLIFKYPERQDGTFTTHRPDINPALMNGTGREFAKALGDRMKTLPLFLPRGSSGYSMTSAFADPQSAKGKDQGYSALRQASNAAISFARNFEKFAQTHEITPAGDHREVAEWVMPVVVVANNLFEGYLDRAQSRRSPNPDTCASADLRPGQGWGEQDQKQEARVVMRTV